MDSRKVYLPVETSRNKTSFELGHTTTHNNGTECATPAHGDSDQTPCTWQLATISPISVELTCAQTIYSRFLEALFSSTRLGEIQQTLGGQIQVESHRHRGTSNYNGFNLPDFRLRNEGIDKLVHIVRESGLYDAPIAAELRVLSAVSQADLLPPATETILG